MKLKTTLFVVGGGLAAFALYRYFQKQLALALNWDYKIKYLVPTNVTPNQILFEGEMDIINPSNFRLTLNSYDLDFYYKGSKVASGKSNKQFVVQPDSTFPAPIEFTLNIAESRSKVLEIADNIYKQAPVNFGIKGTANITFAGSTRNIDIDIPDYEYSSDISADYGFGKPLTSFKDWLCKNTYICV